MSTVRRRRPARRRRSRPPPGNDHPTRDDDPARHHGPPETDVLLGARQTGWVGIEPRSIAEEGNPSLFLEDGETYRVTCENLDANPHSFSLFGDDGFRMSILNVDGRERRRSPVLREIGATQSFTFTAQQDVDMYLCNVHPLTMQGEVRVWTGQV